MNQPSEVPSLEVSSQWGLASLLMAAMALPMLILYASGALAPYILSEGVVSPQLLGGFTLASFGVAALCSSSVGKWVKRSGIKKAGVLLFLFTAVSLALLTRTQNIWLMLAAAGLCGFAQALANPMTNLAIATQVRAQRRPFMVGLKQSGVQLSALIAGSLMPFIANYLGWRFAIGMTVPLCLVFAFIVMFYRWERKSSAVKPKPRGDAKPKTVGCLMIAQGVVGLVLAAFVTQVPILATELGLTPAEAAFSITLFGFAGLLSRLVLTPLASKMNHQSDMFQYLILLAIVAIIITFSANANQIWMLYIGVVGIGSTLVATNALAMAMIVSEPKLGDVPIASGRVSSAFFWGVAAGSLLYQFVVGALESTQAGVILFVVLLMISSLSLHILRRSLDKAKHSVETTV